MAAVQLNSAIIDAIASAFQGNIENIIRQLAEKHNFDPTEAIAEFCVSVKPTVKKSPAPKPPAEKKIPDKKLPTPEFALPWTNKPISHCCDALRSYYGIFSQCINAKHGDTNFCKTCSKKGEAPPCGTIHERSKEGFVAPNGKKPLHYTVFMKKVAKNEQTVRDEAAKFDITLNDDTFIAPKVGRGRPKKSVTVVEDSDDSTINESPKEQKKAGRPKKVVTTEPSVDDLIHNLSPTPSLSHTLSIQIPDDQHIAAKQHIPVSPNDDD